MTLKQYLGTMGGGTALAGTLLALVVFSVDPDKTQVAVFGVFYASLLLALTGLLSLLGFGLRVWLFGHEKVLATQAGVAFRQAVLLAFIIVTLLVLGRRGYLNWLIGTLLLAAATLLEFFFVSLRQRQS